MVIRAYFDQGYISVVDKDSNEGVGHKVLKFVHDEKE